MGQVRSLDNNGTTTEVVYLQGGEGEEDQLVYIEQPGLATNRISEIFFAVFFISNSTFICYQRANPSLGRTLFSSVQVSDP